MEEPGRLQSMGSLAVGHDWETSLSLFTFMHWRRKWQPTPVFLPGESQGQGSLVGCRTWLKRLSSSSIVNLLCVVHFRCTAKLFSFIYFMYIYSVKLLFSHPVMSDSLQPHGLQHAKPPCPSLPPKVCPSSCSLLWWCHPARYIHLVRYI